MGERVAQEDGPGPGLGKEMMAMIDGKEFARSGCRYMGTPYTEMDCQKLWERMLADCGLRKDLGGSNSWYRYIMQHGWCGTPEECKKKYGTIPRGAALFIRKDVSDSTPGKFRDDGIGDITHIGVYTAMTGTEMCRAAEEAGVTDAFRYNYGDGAINSSSTRGGVCTSKFAGKTIPNGGWNRVGLWTDEFTYDDIGQEPDQEPEQRTAMVMAQSGTTVNMRKGKSLSSKLISRVPIGSIVDVLDYGDDWCQIAYVDAKGARWIGYMMTAFLDFDYDQTGITYTVHIPFLTEAQADELLARYSAAWMTEDEPGKG